MAASKPDQHGGYCMICYSELNDSNSKSLPCGHTFCTECWQEYLVEKVNEGYMGIYANCMQNGCNMMVTHSMFVELLENCPKEKVSYWKWLCKSFTEENSNIQWCSNAKCGKACERTNTTQMLYDVKCDECGTVTCFACALPSH